MTAPPLAISLDARLAVGAVADCARIAVEALSSAPLPPLVKWSVPNTARRETFTPGSLPAAFSLNPTTSSASTATMELADGSLGSLFPRYGESDWGFTLDAQLSKHEPAGAPRILAALRSVCRSLLQDPHVKSVSLAFQGAGALCLPTVPIAGLRSYLVSCTEEDASESYGDPEAFWRSGWDATEWIGSRAIVERAMNTTHSAEYLAHVQPQQWELARAAKPGCCQYGLPQVLPDERDVYRGASPALSLVGYVDAEAEVELACSARPPAHVQGYEVFDLYGLMQAGALDDGRPVRGIRVVFLHEEMARAERRPLLDIGVRVLCYDNAGSLITIRD